jgi:hypothetical protein
VAARGALTLETRSITHVAIIYRHKLYALPRPNRHHDVIKLIYEETGLPVLKNWQGFLTDEGKFVGRQEALKIASSAGQVGVLRPKTSPAYILFSEDIW